MSRKYYAHFVTERPPAAGPGEYSGVVELRQALRPQKELAELRTLLATSFDLPAEEIRILNWATLH
ncbi:MAG TPA: hypothetical protein VMH77_05885 [Steroidobacteraceae bacterium]|nr:hypothetical protein [Steroidobacteraceae bacterium]